MTDPNDEHLLARLTDTLSRVPGVCAIALGGSRSRGLATKHSDYDIGLYYAAEEPIDVVALQSVVAAIDDRGLEASVTPIGGWGRWINGGGWLTIDRTRVDLLYRDLVRVGEVISDCRAGAIERHYQPGHPHAFVSTIYMGEVAYCRPLWDPAGRLAELKRLTAPYPRHFATQWSACSCGKQNSRSPLPDTAAGSMTRLRRRVRLPVYCLPVSGPLRDQRCLSAQREGRRRRRGRASTPAGRFQVQGA